ncbi:MAG: serine/threonine-protein kinase [Polyangiaceae bacterium]
MLEPDLSAPSSDLSRDKLAQASADRPSRRAQAGARDSEFDDLLRDLARAPSVRPVDLDLVGRTVGRFVVERRLGEGGMGVVYEATDPVLGRRVALKVLRASHRQGAAKRTGLHEEARRLAALHHPHVATVYDVGEHDGIVFLALERAAGRSLRERLGEQPALTFPRTRILLRAVASALSCAHAAGIVHRDLKPENVVTADDGAVKIIDFGIATLTGHDSRAAGTRKYMAPEQADGSPASARADIFAFGVMAREVLLSTRVRREDRAVHAALLRLADACASVDPGARPRDGAALVDALEAALVPGRGSAVARMVAVGAGAAVVALAGAQLARGNTPQEEQASPSTGTTASHESARSVRSSAARIVAPTSRQRAAAPATEARADAVTAVAAARAHASTVIHAAPADSHPQAEAGAVLADVVLPASAAASSPLARGSSLPHGVSMFVDDKGRLITSVNLDSLGPRAASTAAALATGAPVDPAASHMRVAPDGKGGYVIELILRVPPKDEVEGSGAEGDGEGGGDNGGDPWSLSDLPHEIGPGIVILPNGLPIGRQYPGPTLNSAGTEPVTRELVPPPPMFRHVLFSVEGELLGIRAILDTDGTLQIIGDDDPDSALALEGSDASFDLIATIAASGEVVETGEGVTRCSAAHDLVVASGG